jgi:threonine/homoserine/homoserine lactone efflux protein
VTCTASRISGNAPDARAAAKSSNVTAALALGVAAGLAVALPVGPVALLVMQEGLARGFRVASGAAVGVATVDALDAAVATTVGGGVASLLDGHVPVVRAASAAALVAVAAWGLRQTFASRSAAGAPPAAGVVERATPSRTFARFVALTAVNPLTALAFASVAVGLAPRLAGSGRVAFVVGVACASAAWQLTLAAAGSTLRTRLSASGRTWLSFVGHGAVVVLATVVAFA